MNPLFAAALVAGARAIGRRQASGDGGPLIVVIAKPDYTQVRPLTPMAISPVDGTRTLEWDARGQIVPY